MSEESDPIDNSVETGSKESKIFENSMTEMGKLLMNSDEKTDNEDDLSLSESLIKDEPNYILLLEPKMHTAQ